MSKKKELKKDKPYGVYLAPFSNEVMYSWEINEEVCHIHACRDYENEGIKYYSGFDEESLKKFMEENPHKYIKVPRHNLYRQGEFIGGAMDVLVAMPYVKTLAIGGEDLVFPADYQQEYGCTDNEYISNEMNTRYDALIEATIFVGTFKKTLRYRTGKLRGFQPGDLINSERVAEDILENFTKNVMTLNPGVYLSVDDESPVFINDSNVDYILDTMSQGDYNVVLIMQCQETGATERIPFDDTAVLKSCIVGVRMLEWNCEIIDDKDGDEDES